jgi:hypothetical protein
LATLHPRQCWPGCSRSEKAGYYLLSFIIAAMIFLLLFTFLPTIIRRMMSDTETILELFWQKRAVQKSVLDRFHHACRLRA